jgi:hypothetical protein
VSEDSKKPGSPADQKFAFDLDLEENDRPTVAPPFDIAEFAREVGTAKSPLIREQNSSGDYEEVSEEQFLSGPPPARGKLETITNEVELEIARLRSATLATSPPPPDLSSSLLSLADARTPSIFPDRPPTQGEFTPFDSAWEEAVDPEAPPPPRLPTNARLPKITEATTREEDPVSSGAATVRNASQALRAARGSIGARAAQNATPMGMARPLAVEIDDPTTSDDPLFATSPAESPPPPQSATRATPPETAAADDPLVEMRERFSLGDYSGALVVAEALLEDSPNEQELLDCADNCRAVLRQMYTARIGPLDRVPVVMVPRDQLRWLSIDHRAGFVLSHIDGVSSLEMILDVSGMPLLDALRILCELSQQRIISFR